MPNPIKYTTGSETNALKKGNFYIGTGDVDKGPTNITGYYNGVSPVEGGYTIYIRKPDAAGELSYHSAANNTELISFTNNLSSQTFSTIQQCFNYYYSQTDKLITTQDYTPNFPYIVLDGLILYLDAGITQSYPGSGNLWTDINGLGPKSNGTLINGPTFSSIAGGSIVFDGVNDYVDCGSNSILNLTNNFTISCWINRSSIQASADSGIVGKITNNDSYKGYMLWYTSNTIKLYINGGIRVNSATQISANTWYNIVGTYNGTTGHLYINGYLDSSGNTTVNADATNSNLWVGRYEFGSSRNFTGNISNIQIYNRALAAEEVLQNFDATKSRFGL